MPVPDLTDDANPGELLADQEDRELLWQLARRQLTDTQFQALWLRYVEDMEVAQIADALGKSRVHVKVLLFRARQILARHLSPARTLARAIPNPQIRPREVVRPCATAVSATLGK
jgi:RNA polymerase sigma-70 factor (ECF subfamily)